MQKKRGARTAHGTTRQPESNYLQLLPEPLDDRPTTALGGNDPDIQRAIYDMKATIAAQRHHQVFPPLGPERKMSLVDLTPILPAVDAMRRQLLRRRNWILGGSGIFVVALLVTVGLYLSYDQTTVSAAESSTPIQVVIAPPPGEQQAQGEALVNEASVDEDDEDAADVNKPVEMIFKPELVEQTKREVAEKREVVERPKRKRARPRPRLRPRVVRSGDTVEGVDVDDIISAATSPRARPASRAKRPKSDGVVDDILAAGLQ